MKKVAILGFGFMGMTHAENILKSDDLDLVAIVDKNPLAVEEKLQKPSGNFDTGVLDKEKLDKIRKYASLDDCLAFEELDAVLICVHTDLHYEMTKKVLMDGKHVFLEKPFALDLQQAEELVQLAREKDRILMIGHVVRFMPPYRLLKEFVDTQKFGALKFLSLTRFSGVPAWGEWIERRSSFGSTGGALFDLVIHDIDFVHFLLGTPGSIRSELLPGWLSRYDYVSALWSYPVQDISVKIEGGNTFHASFPFQAGYMAHFEKASVQYTTLSGDVIKIADEKGLTEIPSGQAGDGFAAEVAYFAQCIHQNRQPAECMPESAYQTIQLCYDHIQ
ncbi:MAG: Gfo/Idh/MocA family oxidoreductase [Marinilabiliales bacterium]|nr:Gfo/Idh/MocA family oxidoreductase [Marinilabiliales bacterium]